MGTEIVPFHLAKIPIRDKFFITNGLIAELSNNRRIEVWKVKDEQGICVRIFRPTDDGKTSKMLFGLSPEAAFALGTLLLKQVPPPE